MVTTSIFEQQRNAHEAMERLENLAASLSLDVPRNHKERLTQAHRVSRLVDAVISNAKQLSSQYRDTEGKKARHEEAEAISCDESGKFSNFYARINAINDKYRGAQHEVVEPMELEFMNPDQAAHDVALLEKMFSGEERYGKFLDMHEQYKLCLNIDGAPTQSYLSYLASFAEFNWPSVATKTRSGGEYQMYLESLSGYLVSFITRAQPLQDISQLQIAAHAEFDQLWRERINLSEMWRTALVDDSDPELFCPDCEKQFLRKAVYDSHLKERRHRRAQAAALAQVQRPPASVLRANARAQTEASYAQVARLEHLISCYARHLATLVVATQDNIERMQTLTEIELIEEQEAEAGRESNDANMNKKRKAGAKASDGTVAHGPGGDVDDSDDDGLDEKDERIYNPLKLPLGWDGKPIPYWLYKLHGLGVEYSCEICGNYVYMGRKAFERHFQEWRHTHGMRCLGIPNNKQFNEITQIDDAIALWEKLKTAQKTASFKVEDEEFEDTEGNVVSRKTYEDLLRQGLL